MATRRQALLSWEAELTHLHEAVSVYLYRSSELCQHLYNHGEFGTDDIPLGDALEHVENRLGEIQNVAKDIHDTTRNFLGCRNMWGTLVPVNKLPPEVLSQVILMGLENDQEEKHRYDLFMESEIAYDTDSEFGLLEDETVDKDDPEYDILSYKKPVPFSVIFSHVCRRWRDVALSTARAWTAIDFRKPDDWTRKCLARSKASPLTVFIESDSKKTKAMGDRVNQIMDILLPHISRVVSLDVRSQEHWDPLEVLTSILKEEKTFRPHRLRLESQDECLTINIETLMENDPEALRVYQECSQSVQSLDLSCIYLHWDSPVYHSLTSLRLSTVSNLYPLPTTNQLHAILVASPNLESLQLEDLDVTAPFDAPLDPSTANIVTLERLHTLTLTVKTDGYGYFPLKVLTTPNLVRLKLKGISRQNTLARFVRRNIQASGVRMRASSTVQYLQVSHCNLSEKLFYRVLADMPNIKDLGIKAGTGFTDQLLQSFTPPSNTFTRIPMLPHLHTLRLITCEIRSVEKMQDLVKGRNLAVPPGVCAIKKLVIIDCPVFLKYGQLKWFRDKVEKFVFDEHEETG
ncbi:hypothetical protein FRC02_011703, partial [Tulasnella sp. 418]